MHYSDTPQPGAQVIQMQPAQTYHARRPPRPRRGGRGDRQTRPAPYQSCAITQPAAEASFFAPDSVAVSVQLTPGLRPGDQLAVTVDGAPLHSGGSPGACSFR